MASKDRQSEVYGVSEKSNLDSDIAGLEAEARRRQQQQTMDRKIEQMAEKALDFYQKYGQQDYRYQMMVTFLDVAFQMKDAIAVLTSVQVATEYLSTAIQFIDDTVNFDEDFDKQLLQKNYGIFASLWRRIRTRRAMRNNRRRMMTVIRNISDRLETAHLITDSLKEGFEKMRITMLRADERRRKKAERQAAKNGTALAAPQPTAAETFLMQMAQQRGIVQPAADDKSAGDAKPAPDRGIDDITD